MIAKLCLADAVLLHRTRSGNLTHGSSLFDRLVVNKTTQKLKGTAFVEFHDVKGAEAAAATCQGAR